MANQAMVAPGDLVYDPFVGSGSIALACSYFGATVLGSDLDQRVLRGFGVGRKTYNKDVNQLIKQKLKGDNTTTTASKTEENPRYDIFTNFNHYGLPCPEIFAQDALKPTLRANTSLDAIVCDPPYGIRVRSKGFKEQNDQADSFDVSKIYQGLLEMGDKYLKPRGRLVFLFHTDQAQGSAESQMLPLQHPSFDFIDQSEN